MSDIGITSRGADEELQMLIADLLHQEQHMVEALTKEPHKAKELTKTIDELRDLRQSVVRFWGGENCNPNYWCSTKHNLEAARRIQEIIENTSRTNPEEVPKLIEVAKEIDTQKNKAINNFKQGKIKITDEACFRCEDDFGKENYDKLKNLISESKSLNTSISQKKNNIISNNKKGGIKLNDLQQLGVINAGQFAGKGITIGTDWVDEKYPPEDGAILKKKGLWINAGLGILGQVAALYWIRNDNLKLITTVASSHALTKVVDYAMDAMQSTTGTRMPVAARRAPLRMTPPRAINPGGSGLITVD